MNHCQPGRSLSMPAPFDVIAVYHHSGGTDIEHIENAFYPEVELEKIKK